MKYLNILSDKKTFICLLLITILYVILYGLNLDSYQFLDFFESKYTTIAKELINNHSLLTTTLNKGAYYQTSPLYFWIINSFCWIFGKITPAIVRLPNIIFLFVTTIFIFSTLRRLFDIKYASIATITFLTNLLIIFYAHLAGAEILTVCSIISAILCAYINIINENFSSKMFVLMYFFIVTSGFLSGFMGFIIPLITTVMMFAISNKKELTNKKSIVIGLSFLFFIVMPWHILMLYKYKFDFISTYITLPNYQALGQNLLLIFFIIFPYIIFFNKQFVFKIKLIKNFLSKKNTENIKWKNYKPKNKFLILNTLILVIGILISIVYPTKQAYPVLFMMFPISCLSAHYINCFMQHKLNTKKRFNIISIICIIPIISNLFLFWIGNQNFKETFFMPIIVISYIIPLIIIFLCFIRNKIAIFITYLISIIYLSTIITPNLYNFINSESGGNDLIKLATIAKEEEFDIMAFISKEKYSIPYYYDNYVEFHNAKDYDYLKEYLYNNRTSGVIIKIRNLKNIEENKIHYDLIDTGKKYCLIKYADEQIQEEAEITTY